MLNNFIKNVMGSSLTKNYDVEKEPYMHGGLHNLWKVYRAKKKDRNNMDCSLFIFEKKSLDKKKYSQAQRDDICNILKKDPQNLTKLRHPSLLSLIEQPQEDAKFIIFATEPIEFNLASLVFDATKKELIPGDLEIKCLSLELLEALNFLHNNAKNMHMGLAPEHVYINKEGKLKLGGLNFAQQFSTSESLHVPLHFDLKVGDIAIVPNLRFSAPEISDKQMCSFNTDLFSVGCLIYFMVAINRGKDPFILNQTDITSKDQHVYELKGFDKRFNMLMAGMESDFEIIMRQMLNINYPESRGPLNEVVVKSWFQDPLLKTIKYLETIDSRDHQNKVQFLTGITTILSKFDKKALIKKVIPLLLDQMKSIQLSVNVLPSILDVMERQNYLTTTEFREYIWPSLQKLVKAKELPAQSLYLILKNTELFIKFVGPSEFQSHFLVLINKALEVQVPKLQFLALTKVPFVIKQLDYAVVKTQILPRVLGLIEKNYPLQIKQKTLEVLNEIIPGIDQQTMKDKILKTFEKIRSSETDPQVCMLMLKIYEQMAKTLGVDEIGHKILPGIIPMLISGTFTRSQFTEMMLSVRRLLDQIEKHREKDLRDMGQDIPSSDKIDIDDNKANKQSLSNPTNKDVFDFLNTLDGGSSAAQSQPQSTPTANTSNTQNLMSSQNSNPLNSMMTGLNLNQTATTKTGGDPFAEILGSSLSLGGGQTSNFQPQQQKMNVGGGWDSDLPIISDNKQPVVNNSSSDWASFGQNGFSSTTSAQSKSNSNPLTGYGGGNQSNLNSFGSGFSGIQQNQSMAQNKPINQFSGLGFGASSNNDPFADLIEKPQSQGFSNFGSMNQQPIQQQQQNNQFSMGGGFTGNSMNLNSNNSMGANFGQQPLNNNLGMNNFGQFNQQYGAGIQQQQQNTGYGQFGGMNNNNLGFQQQNNNPLGGLNFGGSSFNTQQNQTGLNLGFGTGFGGNTQQQPQSNLNSGLNDDFFNQFTSQQPKTQQNPFNPF
ncbi:serine threonine protein kinase [Stylonychia lemnae]|uniref:Serine threonine protein kinase n=1 Tax=Stylonychia lemnae TaxID=5949 RepID=A0A078ADF0_STYLE|nr:serine threonine protein kinase [Stylonychia lemnae]|eukprot:CDW79562.1 serine threonine protein kinase [Stylonychia lemnae]